MAGASNQDRRQAALRRAATLMAEALDILDANGTSPETAAHLDVALERVREEIRRR